ncbi:hypothetical protein mru_0626 [Methanobrevibacter ruminantium M1]|uniref:Uncharacterized protein n=1 Tax=Methanobrevibacter ruminantium (strain ATCC 35063 / DSM 1093 / JCM 13430 / OCM 146 / M1) TaxID=634498 RepID=D3E1R6_METRM|nr:hypothetical protein [Methanobrevibacter ruminantium]ADC46477.1 hypothetical protein mru_0626 [Methanobrevibacter ruminantium M1]
MIELNKKYVFHVPLYKYKDEELIPIDMDDILDELIDEFYQNGYDSLYMTNIETYYKYRFLTEILISIFVSTERLAKENQEFPDRIFKKWFKKNNKILEQEAFAYEYNNKMFIEKL